MGLGEITQAGVLSAVREFDLLGRAEFLRKYGFGLSRSFFVLHSDRRYDSKAICGAAHGYDRPDLGPLAASEFSGGSATVKRKLESLGFEVEVIESKTGWATEERVLALDLYLRRSLAGKTDPDVIALSDELNQRALHPDSGSRPNFRNPSGVALKLANFASLDPDHSGAGMAAHSIGDELTWDQYAGDVDLLAAEVARIRSTHARAGETSPSRALGVVVRDIEAQHTQSFRWAPSSADVEAQRREAGLVARFKAWLVSEGAVVSAHHYPGTGQLLRNDLFDETEQRLWEAKGSPSRSNVRMAIGQLADYRRFEQPSVQLGVLLPRRPTDDLVDLIHSAGAVLAWPAGDGFVVED